MILCKGKCGRGENEIIFQMLTENGANIELAKNSVLRSHGNEPTAILRMTLALRLFLLKCGLLSCRHSFSCELFPFSFDWFWFQFAFTASFIDFRMRVFCYWALPLNGVQCQNHIATMDFGASYIHCHVVYWRTHPHRCYACVQN